MAKSASQLQINFTALSTLVYKEVRRFLRIWSQTFIPPVITTSLYFLIFGTLIGERVGEIDGVRYIDFIAPGLVAMGVISNAYNNVSSSFFSAKWQNNLEEQLVAPMSDSMIVLGYVLGGVLRGLLIGIIIGVVTLFFTKISIVHVGELIAVATLTAALFAIFGFLNALYANTFDDVTIIPHFVLTPLIYLGGVFYSISMLSPFWQTVSQFNPILYVVNGFRHAVLGVSDVPFTETLIVLLVCVIGSFALSVYLMRHSGGVRK